MAKARFAPKPRRSTCGECGTKIDVVLDADLGFERALDIFPVADDVDLWAVKLFTWEYLGVYLGWQPQSSPRRRGYEIRLRHECKTDQGD